MVKLLLLIIGFGFSSLQASELPEWDKKESESHVKATYKLLKDIRNRELVSAVGTRDCKKAELWLKAGACPNLYLRYSGGLLRHVLAYPLYELNYEHREEMVNLLLFYKSNPDLPEDYSGPMDIRSLAVEKGFTTLTRMLDISKSDYALIVNSIFKQPEITMYLLSKGADVNYKKRELIPLDCALDYKDNINDSKLLIPNVRQIRYLLCFGATIPKQHGNPLEIYLHNTQLIKHIVWEEYNDVSLMQIDRHSDSNHHILGKDRTLREYREICNLLESGPTEKDYEKTSHDFIEFNCEPRKRGNMFNQLSYRQCGISKQMSAAIVRRK